MTMKIVFAAPQLPESGALAVGVAADRALTPAAAALDEASGGAVGRALGASPRFTGKREDLLPLAGLPGVPGRVVLIGLGDAATVDAAALQRLGGVLAAHFGQTGVETAAIRIDGLSGKAPAPAAAAAEIAMGASLRFWRFDKYRTTEKPEAKPALARLTVMTDEPAAARRLFARADKVAEGVFFAREVVSEPANILYPESFAERLTSLADAGVEVEVLDEKKLKKLGFGALLGVGQGSVRESRVVVMRWHGHPKGDAEAPLAVIGKGVTFDTGGISIKPAQGMEEMKWDMAGAGVVGGLMKALAGRKAKANVVGVVGLVENMPSGSAQRPGDIVKSLSGQTIEVLNTDAEGRLVLADALWYAQDRFKPRAMIDLATLTGAIIVALGGEHAGMFANDDALAEALLAAGRATGELLWRMPLADAYDRDIDGDAADVKNIAGHRFAGSIVGAQFLQRFVNKVPWAHLDIAGVAWSKKDAPLVPKGGTGFGVRLLDRLVAERYEA
jgi:leucyl aminopeptidase